MKVTEHLDRATEPLISFEIIPPLRGGNFRDLVSLIEDLVKYTPPFIDITSHAAEVIYEETPNGIRKKVKRKRPGTLGVCALIQNKYDIDAVPHVLCQGFTREETEDLLIELRYLGIDNVLAARGDILGYKKVIEEHRSVNRHASELVQQIDAMNHGRYLEDDLLDSDASDFCIGVAGYPEKHFESPNPVTDLRFTKEKVDAGADYLVTQMFFDNQHYFSYVKRCREIGIDVPIIPGLKILTAKSHLRSIPGNFFIDIPADLSDEVMAARPEHVPEIGIEWTVRQTEELINGGVPAVHFFVMQSSRVITKLVDKLKG
jgi:methylenetetrahydrofolate reductase (NADPH)